MSLFSGIFACTMVYWCVLPHPTTMLCIDVQITGAWNYTTHGVQWSQGTSTCYRKVSNIPHIHVLSSYMVPLGTIVWPICYVLHASYPLLHDASVTSEQKNELAKNNTLATQHNTIWIQVQTHHHHHHHHHRVVVWVVWVTKSCRLADKCPGIPRSMLLYQTR